MLQGDTTSQTEMCVSLTVKHQIQGPKPDRSERKMNRSSVIVGDFSSHCWNGGMVQISGRGLGAETSRVCPQRGSKIIERKNYS